jgi:ubiquinone/menaquinone biosynthesis C-methylase UbiE
VVRIGAGDSVSELAERVAPEGDVLVVDHSVDALEHLRKTTRASNIFYLVGSMDVLPLTDASADEILTSAVPGDEAAAEFFRVLRSGGRVAIATGDQDHAGPALNLDAREVERLFSDAGFTAVTVAAARGRLAVAAHKP